MCDFSYLGYFLSSCSAVHFCLAEMLYSILCSSMVQVNNIYLYSILSFAVSALILKIWPVSFKRDKEKSPQHQRSGSRWKEAGECLSGLTRSLEEKGPEYPASHNQTMEKNLCEKSRIICGRMIAIIKAETEFLMVVWEREKIHRKKNWGFPSSYRWKLK